MIQYQTTASFSAVARFRIENAPGALARLLHAIGERGGQIGAIDLVEAERKATVRDVSFQSSSEEHLAGIISAVGAVEGVELLGWQDTVFRHHEGGKIEIRNRMPVDNRDGLSIAYTPGVARVCTAIHRDREKVYDYTIKGNTVAVVTDGSAVLGLGDIGPEAALPVMEGKAMLFKEFAGVDAWPVCLATKDVDEIVRAVECIAPGFGGVNLEDISAPRCFEIEERLRKSLDIPVFHDDQHGTAVVALAGLINALKVVGKRPEDVRVVVSGVGAAGVACAKMMLDYGVRDIVGVDSKGAVYKGRPTGMNSMKEWFAENTNAHGLQGSLSDVCEGADVFLGVSVPGILTAEDVQKMAVDPIIFALSNPVPEIMPEEAAPHARIVATGRSDYPNQINNVLGFPGIFRGALLVNASEVNEPMKLAAAKAIAGIIADEERFEENIIPSVFDRRVVEEVSRAVARAAIDSGVARRDSLPAESETSRI